MFVKVFSGLLLAGYAAAQALTINTPPSLIQCQPASISWSGGTAPYILAVIPGEQTTAPAISTITDSVQSSPYTWIVNVPANTFITIRITDAAGNNQYSSALTIQSGSDSCLSGGSSSAGASASSAVASASSAASSVASSSGVASSSSAAVASSSTSSSAAASSSASASRSSSAAASSSASASRSSSTPGNAASSASSAAATPSGAANMNAYAPIPMALGVIGAAVLAF